MLQFQTTRWVAALVAAGAGCTLAADGTVRNRLTNITTEDIHVHLAADAGALPSSLRVRTGDAPGFQEPSRDGIRVPTRGWIEFEVDPLAGPKTKPDYHLTQVPFRIVSADQRRWEDCQFNGHGVWNPEGKSWDPYGFLIAPVYQEDQGPFTSIRPQQGAGKNNFEFIGFVNRPAGLARVPQGQAVLPHAETKVPAGRIPPVPAHRGPAAGDDGKASAPSSTPSSASTASPAGGAGGGQATVPAASKPPADPAAAAGTGVPATTPAGGGQTSGDPSTQPPTGGASTELPASRPGSGTAGRAPSAGSGASFGLFGPTAVPFINLCRATIELRFPDDLAEVQGDRNARMTPDGTRLTGTAGLVWDKDRVRLNHKAALTFSFDFGHCGRFLVAGSHSLRFRAVSLGGTHAAEFQYSARCVAGSGGREREFHADIRDLPRAERRSGPAPAWPALPGASSAFLFTPLETLVFTAP